MGGPPCESLFKIWKRVSGVAGGCRRAGAPSARGVVPFWVFDPEGGAGAPAGGKTANDDSPRS
jgi:hypothetical protein